MLRHLKIIALVAGAVIAVFCVSTSYAPESIVRAQDNTTAEKSEAAAEDTEISDFQRRRAYAGLNMAPVPLNLEGKNPIEVGLGSYIVNAQAACSECHTNPSYVDGGDPFLGQPKQINTAGYLAGGQSFGPFISRNLTPDANGLPAGLTLNKFLEVMKKGTDFEKKPPNVPSADKDLLQVMPWPVFQEMTAHDLRAIYEYLRAIPSLPDGGGATASVKK
jgi:hypothetical protein